MSDRYVMKDFQNIFTNILAPIYGKQAGGAAVMTAVDTLTEYFVRKILKTMSGTSVTRIGAAHVVSLPFRGAVAYKPDQASQLYGIDDGLMMAPSVLLGQYIVDTGVTGLHLPKTGGMLWNIVSVAVAQAISQPAFQLLLKMIEPEEGGAFDRLQEVLNRQRDATLLKSN